MSRPQTPPRTSDSAPDLLAHQEAFHRQTKAYIKTSSSTFITRIQTAEGLSKTLQTNQEDATFLFYLDTTFVWVDAGVKYKVSPTQLLHVTRRSLQSKNRC